MPRKGEGGTGRSNAVVVAIVTTAARWRAGRLAATAAAAAAASGGSGGGRSRGRGGGQATLTHAASSGRTRVEESASRAGHLASRSTGVSCCHGH